MVSKNYLVIGTPRSEKLVYVKTLIGKNKNVIWLDPRLHGITKSIALISKAVCDKDFLKQEDPSKNFEILKEEFSNSVTPATVVINHLEEYVTSPDKQHLLYQIFDMAHNVPVEFTIYAISSVPFVLDLFEKRVKSRFPHTVLTVPYSTIDEHEKTVNDNLKELYKNADVSRTEVVISYNSSINEKSRIVKAADQLDVDINEVLENTYIDELYVSMKRLPRYQMALLYCISRYLRDSNSASASLGEIVKAVSLTKSSVSDPVKLDKMPIYMIEGWLYQLCDIGLLSEIRRHKGVTKKYRPVLRRDNLVTYARVFKEDWLKTYLN